jgi:hypothetical protein
MSANKTLLARQKSRERDVTVGSHAYTIRRPKPAEMLQDMTRMDLVRRFVVGWDLKNIDLVPGGTPDPEPFDSALFADYVEDDPELWQPLADAVLGFWREYLAAKETAAKN